MICAGRIVAALPNGFDLAASAPAAACDPVGAAKVQAAAVRNVAAGA